jgi:hypothetical protein
MCSLSVCNAKLCKAGSGSARKPTRPAAEVRPTMVSGLKTCVKDVCAIGIEEMTVARSKARWLMTAGRTRCLRRQGSLSKLRRAKGLKSQGQFEGSSGRARSDGGRSGGKVENRDVNGLGS